MIPVKGEKAEAVSARAEAWIETEMRRLFPHHYADESAAPAGEAGTPVAAAQTTVVDEQERS